MDERWITDWTPSERHPLYTRANVGEILPDPVSPVCWDFVWGAGGVAHGWADGCHRWGAFSPSETNPDEPDFVGCFGGYAYLNASLIRLVGVRSPGMDAATIDLALLGNHPDLPPYEPKPGDESDELTATIEATMGWIMTATEEPQELADDRAKVAALADDRPDLSSLTDAELVERARSIRPVIRDVFERYYMYGSASAVGPGILAAVCAEIDPSLPNRLISGLGGIDSVPPSEALWALGRTVAASPGLTAAFDATDGELIEHIAHADDGGAFLDALADTCREHGARGPGEWDPANPTWGVDARPVLAAVDRLRFAPDDLSPSTRQQRAVTTREAAEAQARAAVAGNDEASATLELGMQVAKTFVPTRERTKLTQMMAVHEIRLPMYELAARLVGRGVIADERDVFLVLDAEFDDFVADPESFADTLRSRAATFAELAELQPPFILDGEVPPLSEWATRTRSDVPVAVGEVLTGIGGCPGNATGRARVILDPSEAGDLETGDILVAPITDPGWTPLFLSAGAVVVEVGAPLSHAVIVSREMGVPCAVSVMDAASRIPDGALISVDGSAGTVTIVELPA